MDNEDSDDEIPLLRDLDEVVDAECTIFFEDDGETPHLEHVDGIKQLKNDGRIAKGLPPVPVTILTGFLGSGKTTLVRHILTSPHHERRIAVIENEFGGGEGNAQLAERLGLTVNDASTLSVETMIARDGTDGSSLTDFIELPNGCVCCTVKDSLVETLENLLAKRTDLDYVIIEASGMADPGPVASIFWLDEALESRIRLDGIVTCVDAKNICFQLESTSSAHGSMPSGDGGGDEAARQIAFADRIIVNKGDLLQSRSPTDKTNMNIEMVLREIKSINPTAPIKTTKYSKVEVDWVLDANCFDAERVKDVESAFQESINDNPIQSMMSQMQKFANYNEKCNDPTCIGIHEPNDLCGLCCEPPPSFNAHQHTSSVGTIALFGRGSVDLHKINSWLAAMLWPNQDKDDKVLRARLENWLSDGVDGNNAKNSQSKILHSSNLDNQTIYRVKGVLSVGHPIDDAGNIVPSTNDWVDDGLATCSICCNDGLDKRRFIVQAVNDLWDVLPASENLCWDANETRCCKVVVIGKWLDKSQLRKGFQDCFNSY